MKENIRDAFRQLSRNLVWGTCGDCPRDAEGKAYPEFCQHKQRHDHKMDVTILLDVMDRENKRP